MLSKSTVRFILFTCLITAIRGRYLKNKGCYECEEEVWEEVPCAKVPSNATAVPTSPPPILPTSPTTKKPTTPAPAPSLAPCPTSTPSTTIKPYTTTPTVATLTTPKDPYKKCYCECKMGCKEFCRKVVVNPFEKQIVQVSKITEPIEKGHIESTHILQREWVTKTAKPCKHNDHYKLSDVEESEKEDGKTAQALALPQEVGFDEDAASEPEPDPEPYEALKVPAKNCNSNPVVPPAGPIYGPYAVTEASVNDNIPQFNSYLRGPQQHPPYFGSFNAPNDYGFAIPFEHLFTKVAKSILNPTQNTGISQNAPSAKLTDPVEAPYSEPIPGIDTPLQPPGPLDEYDDSFNSFLMNVINDDPAKESTYQTFSKPFYSVPYNSI